MFVWKTGNGQRAEARMTIVAFAFVPLLGGREVVLDSPEQSGPLQSLLRAMIATMTEP